MIEIQRNAILIDYWQVFTRNSLGIQTYVGEMKVLSNTVYIDIIKKAEKNFKKEIRRINNE